MEKVEQDSNLVLNTKLFLSCTVVGVIPRGVATVQKIAASRELYLLTGIRRIQSLVPGDGKSPGVLTFSEEENLPKGKIVLRETYDEISQKLKPTIL